MVSVENFYWILSRTLLEPADIDCWYYYPFGTTQNISHAEFAVRPPGRGIDAHALFHFDQEPLWYNSLGDLYDLDARPWTNKTLKILANSEHSDIKRHICRDRNMMDWYYFYHGFAVLDWFRDARYLESPTDISRAFCSLNHLVRGKRAYRMALLARFYEHGITDRGLISFHGDRTQCQKELADPAGPLTARDRDIIDRFVCAQALPLTLDNDSVCAAFSARFGHREFAMWQQAFLHVVNETVFYDAKLHLTEKTFKPIVAMRPFVLAAAPGNLEYLRSYGFKTFGDWIDESYDHCTDAETRLDLIATQVARIASLSMSELRAMHRDMMPVLQHNRSHLFGEFRNIIVDELVDNFDACIRIWNNGRVDGRQRPLHPDLDSARRLLKSGI